MKKLLAVTALFLAFGFNSTDAIAKEKEETCFDKAWRYGTVMGEGWEYLEWHYMNEYYNDHCL
ncbi:hypothetical protein [Haloflavibacter putidus]|uniref:Uncharacterized protein n=1 Tax=Haloflavibacter putidus TaxID=2576776 RepID=A0A507ZSC0_9FLAO|nr:hypothetical protein [Haloflavibacter putidus]TQD40696.1 hypothetical protein FKR84_01570 [Haloflavibacter putidus]